MPDTPEFKIPYGCDFSPEKIPIKELLKLAAAYDGKTSEKLINSIAKKYFNDNTKMANNCKNSMVAYGILEPGGGVNLSNFGKELITMRNESKIYKAMGTRILIHLSGLMFIEAIKIITNSGNRPTLVSITETLNMMGCEPLAKTNKHVPTMKKWLEKAKVLEGWDINERVLEIVIGVKKKQIEVLKGLNHAQVCFVRALCNVDTGEFQSATLIRNLAQDSFNVSFEEKNFSVNIIRPLENKNIIERKASTETHGGNPALVRLVDEVKTDILAPVLQQIEVIAGKELIKYVQKPLTVLRDEIDNEDVHTKGLALEAFAINVMRIIDLNFVGTRLKGKDTGGAEVDVIFDTTRLHYSRWQVQCKNTSTVSLDQVAKEVGLAHMLKSNVIVILTTGRVSKSAKEYAMTIMKELNLCIIFIENEDVKEILQSPGKIVGILNRESMKAKNVKVLDII